MTEDGGWKKGDKGEGDAQPDCRDGGGGGSNQAAAAGSTRPLVSQGRTWWLKRENHAGWQKTSDEEGTQR